MGKKLKPITFRADEVQATLNIGKTAIRRVIKPQPLAQLTYAHVDNGHGLWRYPDQYVGDKYNILNRLSEDELCRTWKPPCVVGDILYVQETWKIQAVHHFEADACIAYKAGGDLNAIQFLEHRSDFENRYRYDEFINRWATNRWYSPVVMPYEIARIFLRVKDVKVDRLQNITDIDCKKEGLRYYDEVCQDESWHPTFYDPDSGGCPSLIRGFSILWNRFIKKSDLKKYGWETNPWAWVIEYERISKEEALKE